MSRTFAMCFIASVCLLWMYSFAHFLIGLFILVLNCMSSGLFKLILYSCFVYYYFLPFWRQFAFSPCLTFQLFFSEWPSMRAENALPIIDPNMGNSMIHIFFMLSALSNKWVRGKLVARSQSSAQNTELGMSHQEGPVACFCVSSAFPLLPSFFEWG